MLTYFSFIAIEPAAKAMIGNFFLYHMESKWIEYDADTWMEENIKKRGGGAKKKKKNLKKKSRRRRRRK